ncbi:beta propeller repeat protein [Natronorarus salvus]|uniref:glycosyl hydrolase n=1 Tax=Natronorarus salvus TaxID=3117733 RepID=UPI002F266364
MDRRRFVALSGAMACPCVALAGCVVDNPTGGTGGSDDGDDPVAPGDGADDHVDRHDDDGDEDDEEEEELEPHDGRPITDYQLEVHDERENGHVFWVDGDGVMYGRSGPRVLRSEDWWESTETIYSFAGDVGEYNDNIVQNVLVPENGRIIAGVGGRGLGHKASGRIELLDEDLEGSTTVYHFEYGRLTGSFGHVVYGDVIVLGAYGQSDFEGGNHANEVVLSTDGGGSFERILEAELHTKNAPNLHVHDVEYDPYAERIWVTVGDGGNSNIYWSDDMGGSWDRITDDANLDLQPTQVAAFEDCVVFGTDSSPEGIVRWAREEPDDAPASTEELVRPHVRIEDGPDPDGIGMRMYARRRWHVREADGRELCIIPFGYSPMHPNARESVVLASVDGDRWYELHRVDDEEVLLTNVLGPLSMDGDRRTLVSDSALYDGHQIDATVPEFWR